MKNIENKNPLYRGTVQDEDRKELGNVALWKNESSNEKAPVLKGKLTKEDGTVFTVSLWNFVPKKDKVKITKQSTL